MPGKRPKPEGRTAAWKGFTRRHRGNHFLEENPLYSLSESLIADFRGREKNQRSARRLERRRFAITPLQVGQENGRFFLDRAFLMILRRFSASRWQGGSRAVRYGNRSSAVNGSGCAACASRACTSVGPS